MSELTRLSALVDAALTGKLAILDGIHRWPLYPANTTNPNPTELKPRNAALIPLRPALPAFNIFSNVICIFYYCQVNFPIYTSMFLSEYLFLTYAN